MNEKYNRMRKIVLNALPEIPDLITKDWIEKSLDNEYFGIWGFSFSDLSNKKFEDDIDNDILRRVNYSTKTIFPSNSPIAFNRKMIGDSDEYKSIHDDGINGEGINVAVIDYGFITVHDELKNKIVNEVTCEGECHFHGSIVSSILAGNNIGICPKSKLYFFESPYFTQVESVISSLKKIYELNNNGADIRVVNISAIMHRKSPEYEILVDKLKSQGCYVLDCKDFLRDFVSINKDFYTGECYYHFMDLNNKKVLEYLNSNIGVYNNSRVLPLHETENDYIYEGQVTNSWTIPIVSGLFALCLQIDKDITYDDFTSIARETKITNKDGKSVINPVGIINKVKQRKNNLNHL